MPTLAHFVKVHLGRQKGSLPPTRERFRKLLANAQAESGKMAWAMSCRRTAPQRVVCATRWYGCEASTVLRMTVLLVGFSLEHQLSPARNIPEDYMPKTSRDSPLVVACSANASIFPTASGSSWIRLPEVLSTHGPALSS